MIPRFGANACNWNSPAGCPGLGGGREDANLTSISPAELALTDTAHRPASAELYFPNCMHQTGRAGTRSPAPCRGAITSIRAIRSVRRRLGWGSDLPRFPGACKMWRRLNLEIGSLRKTIGILLFSVCFWISVVFTKKRSRRQSRSGPGSRPGLQKAKSKRKTIVFLLFS